MKEFTIEYCEGMRNAYDEINGLINVLHMTQFIDSVAKNKLQEFTAIRLRDIDGRMEYILDAMEDAE